MASKWKQAQQNGAPVVERKQVPLSVWAQDATKHVTRGELISVLGLYDRQVEQAKWWRRLWRFLEHGWRWIGPRRPRVLEANGPRDGGAA